MLKLLATSFQIEQNTRNISTLNFEFYQMKHT
jgi:hypothetical protein